MSGHWGLVDQLEVLAPYDMHLAAQRASYRRAWRSFVTAQLLVARHLVAGEVVEIHAGGAYVAALCPPLTERGLAVSGPVVAASIGQTLSWYDARMLAPGVFAPVVVDGDEDRGGSSRSCAGTGLTGLAAAERGRESGLPFWGA